MKTALIIGATGQDGAYLADLLLLKNYRVVGTSRNPTQASLARLQLLGIDNAVELIRVAPDDAASVNAAMTDIAPHEVYLLGAQSSVGASFRMPRETMNGIVTGTLNVLEAMRVSGSEARLCHAGSGESFGDLNMVAAREDTPLRPQSPYGVAKASAQMLVSAYRHSYDLHCSNAILFNHESPMRPDHFVTSKIVRTAARIASGSTERLSLGSVDVARDWGWAPDYVRAMWLTLQQPQAADYVIATGRSVPLAEFADHAFSFFGLTASDHIDVDPGLFRASDPLWSGGDPQTARSCLGWAPTMTMPALVQRLCALERDRLSAVPRAAAEG